MKLFETYFRVKWDTYIRYYDTDLKKSVIIKSPNNNEYYVDDKNGNYKCLLDENRKLSVRYGFVPKELKDKKIHGITNAGHACIRDVFWKNGDYNLNPGVFFLDIETTSYNAIDTENCPEKIVLIQIFDTTTKRMIVLGLEHTNLRNYEYPVNYIKCADEKALLESFIKILKTLQPLIVTAWNGNGFDFVYIYKRMKLNNVDVNNLGLGGETELRTRKLENGQIFHELKTGGIIYLDYLELYKSYTFTPRESYSLDFIAEAELNENKVPHNCFTSFDGFRTGEGFIVEKTRPTNDYEAEMWDLYQNKDENKDKIKQLANDYFVHYGIIDTYLLYKLNNKLKLTDILVMVAKITGVSPHESMGRTKPWERYISNTLFFENIVIPDLSLGDGEKSPPLKGGYVMEPTCGKHEWIFSVDLSSAYPNLSMRGFNISPETLVPYDKIPNDLKEYKDKYFNNEDEYERFELYKSCLDENGIIKENSIYDNYVKLLNKYNLVGTMYGTFYRKDKQGIVPRLVAEVFNNRKKAKNEMLDSKKSLEELKHQQSGTLDLNLIEKLKTEIIKLMPYIDQKHAEQLVLKVLANSIYGALGYERFKLFNIHNARSVTACTRFYLHMLSYGVSEAISKWAGLKEKKVFSIYGDTDSCLGITIVNINGERQTIEEFYNNSEGEEIKKSEDNYIKQLTKNYVTPSVNQNMEIENNQITYIKKHKVKKRFYKIKVNNKEVVITEDHSIMIVRDNKLIEVKPKDIIKGDKIVTF